MLEDIRDSLPLQERGVNTAWYRALTLDERSYCRGKERQNRDFSERAFRKLQRWKEQKPFSTESLFKERLAIEHLTEDLVLALLSETSEEMGQRISPPSWMLEITHALTNEVIPEEFSQVEEQYAQKVSPLLGSLERLIEPSLRKVRAGILQMEQQYTYLPFHPKTIIEILFASIPEQIIPQLNRTFILELNVARLQGDLKGENGNERFKHFLHQLRNEGRLKDLLEDYPVLGRQLMQSLSHWATYALEFLHHLCHDWNELCATFCPGNDPGKLVAVDGGVGDVHCEGRSVLQLTFSSGFRLIYKPKSLAIDIHFQKLLTWFNEYGMHTPPFPTLTLLDKGTYGWSEYVMASDCASIEEVKHFYERLGAYLAILYALQATDFHHENLIAAGEYPILVDLEALLQPYVKEDQPTHSSDLASNAIGYSVMRTGLLPQFIWSGAQSEGVDVSGIGGKPGQFTPWTMPAWKNAGTDEMHLERQSVQIPASQNRPRLQGRDVNEGDYLEQIIEGFMALYHCMVKHRNELLAFMECFSHDRIRVILRPTNIYGRLLHESFHPDFLHDAFERDRFLDLLWVSVEQLPFLRRVIAAERADLLRGDIPLFTTYPDTCDLYTSDGACIEDLFASPGLSVVKERIQQLGEHDLAQQLWYIRAAFATASMGLGRSRWKGSHLLPSQREVSQQDLLRAACAVGDRLDALALRGQDDASWVGLTLMNERTWMLTPTGADLYNGQAGIILFLSYLGAMTNEERYLRLAKAGLISMQHQVSLMKQHVSSIGAFDGWGSLLYLYAHLGALWGEKSFFDEAEHIAISITDLIEKDTFFDMISGSAGYLAALLSLYQVTASSHILSIANRCGEHLLAHMQMTKSGAGWCRRTISSVPLAGFSHGNAGIALSLLRLSEVTHETRFYEASIAAIEYERSLFSVQKQNWPDLRNETIASQQRTKNEHDNFMVTWCHGAPGIGLARLATLHLLEDASIRAEIQAALETTLTAGFGQNHSLCHGDLGNLDVLLVARQVLNDARYDNQLKRITAMVLDSIDREGWCTGIPLGVETPGLMMGLAGIGYGLLRLAFPDAVPSVLLLAPPNKI